MNGGNGQEHNFFRRPLFWLVLLVLLLVIWLVFVRGRVAPRREVSPEEAASVNTRQALLGTLNQAPPPDVSEEEKSRIFETLSRSAGVASLSEDDKLEILSSLNVNQ